MKSVDGGTIGARDQIPAAQWTGRNGAEEVRTKTEPVEILKDGGLVLRTASLAIVVLDAQKDPTVARTSAPHTNSASMT